MSSKISTVEQARARLAELESLLDGENTDDETRADILDEIAGIESEFHIKSQ